MSETCAVCREGKGPTKCEICGFSDDGSINRSFPVPEDLNNWLETVVKPYRALWEAKKRENELLAQLEEAKKREAGLLAQISTPAPIPVSPVQQQPSRTWPQPSQWSSPSPAPEEQTSSFSLTKSVVILLTIIASVVIIKIMLNSDSSKAHFDSGNAHYKKMAYDEAIEDYTVAIKLKPDESTYLNSRGNAYYSRGVKYSDKKDYDLAITDYTTAIKLKPDNSVYLYNRGNAYYNKEDYDLAIADFEAALRINPDYANAKRDIKNAQQAQSKLKQNSQNIAIKQKSNFNESSSSTAKSSSSADRIPQQKTLLTTRSSSTVKNNSRTFSEIDSPSNELRNLCYKERSIGGYCGVGLWTSNSKDTALQIAIFHAKGDMALNIRNEISIVGNWLSSITDSVSEKITGIRSHSKLNKNGNKMKNSEICTIVNVKGKVSLVKISEDSHIVEYYILVNGKIAGSCTYQKGDEKLGMEEAELYTVKVSEGVPDIQIQKTRTIYDQEKKEYTVYVLVTLPKALVSE